MSSSEPAAPPLYRATVPVFLGVLDRIEAELVRAEARLGGGFAAALGPRPAAGMLSVDRQVATAVQFCLRIAFALTGVRAPELRGPMDAAGLKARLAAALFSLYRAIASIRMRCASALSPQPVILAHLPCSSAL